jgi:hypothetical protein
MDSGGGRLYSIGDLARRTGLAVRTIRFYSDPIRSPSPPRVVRPARRLRGPAAVITDWEQRGIPGLLQTEDYARAVIRACRPYNPPEAWSTKSGHSWSGRTSWPATILRICGSSSPKAC